MFWIEKNDNEVIVREVPVFHWILSLVILLILAVVGLLSFLYLKTAFELFSTLLICLSSCGYLLYIFASPATTTKINKSGKTVSVRRQSLFKYNFEIYSFSDIEDLIFIDTKNNDLGGRVNQLLMPLKNGKTAELSAPDGSKENEYFDLADLMNSYIEDLSELPSVEISKI